MKFQNSDEQRPMADHNNSQTICAMGDAKFEVNKRNDAKLSLIEQKFQNVIKNHLSFQKFPEMSQNNNYTSKPLRVRKARSGKLGVFDLKMFKITDIMTAAYNGEQLRQSQYKQLKECFKLNKKQIKQVNTSDPKTLQILRYLIFNRQYIPQCLVKVIDKMAKAQITKQNELNMSFMFSRFRQEYLKEQFEPPLDLYLDCVDTGIIYANLKQLIEVYDNNQCLFQRIYKGRLFYQTLSQSKRLIFNQFPYMLEIFNRINVEQSKDHTLCRFQIYFEKILAHLELSKEEQLLQRYLPEVKCKYLKIKHNLSRSDMRFLFTCLKSVCDLSVDDINTLYNIKLNYLPKKRMHKVNSSIKFFKNLELCSNILTKKDYHLTQQQLEQMGEMLNYQKCFSIDILSYNFIIVMLREQSFRGRSFSKSLIKSIEWVFKSIPDKKKIKQCCYILVIQYFQLVYKNPDKREDIVIQYTFPHLQIENILDEGRFVALDLLISQEDQNLVFESKELQIYIKILRKIISETKNKTIRIKTIQLQKRISKLNNHRGPDLNFYFQKLLVNNQLIEVIQIDKSNAQIANREGLINVYRVLQQNHEPHIRRSCLYVLKSVLQNLKIEQALPEDFSRNLIVSLSKLYFEQNLPDGYKDQILNLAIQSTNLIGVYMAIDVSTKFFFKIYTNTPTNSLQNINSSFGIYKLALNLNQLDRVNKIYSQIAKQYLQKFLTKVQRNYKTILQPNSKSNLNILCSITTLAKNRVTLSSDLIQKLSIIALKNKIYAELPLLAIYFHMENSKQISFSQYTLVNICQILRQRDDQIIAMSILQKYFSNQVYFSYKVRNEVSQLKKISKNETLCTLCKQILQFFVPDEKMTTRRSEIPKSQCKKFNNVRFEFGTKASI